jgi:hypothetical protein
MAGPAHIFRTNGGTLPRRAAVALALLGVGLTVSGCVTDGRMDAMAQAGDGATLTFDSIDGPPPQVFQQFVEALNAEAQGRALPIASREGAATYRVRAYLAAQTVRGRTSIAWVFDVYDANQQRTLRLAGDEPAGRAGRDAWTSADPQMLRRIAQNGIGGVASLMNGGTPEPSPAAPAPSRGPAVAQWSDPASGQTTLAFRAE